MDGSLSAAIYFCAILFTTTAVARERWTQQETLSGLDKSVQKMSRRQRSVNSKCGTDFIFDYLKSTNGMNRTSLKLLMKKMSIGNVATRKQSSCEKVFSWNLIVFTNPSFHAPDLKFKLDSGLPSCF